MFGNKIQVHLQFHKKREEILVAVKGRFYLRGINLKNLESLLSTLAVFQHVPNVLHFQW